MVCVFTAVCVHLGWVKCSVYIQRYGLSYLAICHVTFTIVEEIVLECQKNILTITKMVPWSEKRPGHVLDKF